jgi:hypothetical protein
VIQLREAQAGAAGNALHAVTFTPEPVHWSRQPERTNDVVRKVNNAHVRVVVVTSPPRQGAAARAVRGARRPRHLRGGCRVSADETC